MRKGRPKRLRKLEKTKRKGRPKRLRMLEKTKRKGRPKKSKRRPKRLRKLEKTQRNSMLMSGRKDIEKVMRGEVGVHKVL